MRVGEVEDLAQEVRDEDDRLPPAAEPTDDLVEPLDLHGGQARRRLVEDDEVGVARERAQDLDLLLLGERQPTDHRPRVQVEPGSRAKPLEPSRRAPVDR